jgi:hypothetical protein
LRRLTAGSDPEIDQARSIEVLAGGTQLAFTNRLPLVTQARLVIAQVFAFGF